MNNPCEWCKSTSEQIDSIEYQLEVELLAKKRHLERNEGYFSVICEALEIDHKSKLSDILIAIEAKDKVIVKLKSVLLRIQKQCELDGYITKGITSAICYKAIGNGE